MTRQDWRDAIYALPVLDTHTHLNMPGVPVPAQDFWDIAHYFWFQQELWSVGYPREAPELAEEQRIEHFVRAFDAVRNTHWHLVVRQICSDLYGVRLVDAGGRCSAERVRAVDEAVRAGSQDPGWARAVIDRLNIRRITMNSLRDAALPDLPGVGVAVPTWDEQSTWSARLVDTLDPRAIAEEARAAAQHYVAELATMGIRGMRVAAEAFEDYGTAAVNLPDEFKAEPIMAWQANAFLAHTLFHALGQHGMFAQLFLGIERDVSPRTSMAVNDPRRITNLYPLFERYTCGFEMVIGAPQNNLDAAQAARIYPNVHLGGLWWYNFRASTYAHTMQTRIEAVPASKSAIVASDARCIEWCYGKILLVKWLLADFLREQVKRGWLAKRDAMWVASEWLHDAAARRYTSGD
jgi:hypothetical protein